MTVTEAQVREQLKQVIDPELFINIVDLGLIYKIDLGDGAADDSADAGAATPGPVAVADVTVPQPAAEEPAAEQSAAEAPAAEQPATEQPATEQPATEQPASEQPAAASDGEAAADGVEVKIEMTMTSPMCPAGPQLVANSKQAVGQLPGVGNVEVKVVMDPPWTPDLMTEDAKDKLGIF